MNRTRAIGIAIAAWSTLLGCAHRPVEPSSTQVQRPELSPRGEAAYAVLLETQRFTDGAIYAGGDTPVEVVALRHLWDEPRAAQAFAALLEEAHLGGQLFALCGLYYSDPSAFERSLGEYAESDRTVTFQSGCSGIEDMPVRELVASPRPNVVRLEDRGQSVRTWVAGQAEGQSFWYDIRGGAYPNVFKAEGGYGEVRSLTLEQGAR